MTNREKFAEKILDIACGGNLIAVNKVTLEPIRCRGTACKECLFNFNGDEFCIDKRKKWANSEYIEPPVDWSKVPVDTPILVRNYENCEWIRRYFARYVNGHIFVWHGGATSWSTNYDDVAPWKYAKLAESEE